ncbi:hypothetical protein GCM10028818_61730 [Spirosoma horti]
MLSCTKKESVRVTPEYTDWYTLTSPIDDVIQGVWGDYDGTLIIATTYSLYQSTDKGVKWQLVDEQKTSISGIVEHNDTLFSMNGVINMGDDQLVANASKYSVNGGRSWVSYDRYNPFFDTRPSQTSINKEMYINKIVAPNGTTYRINKVYLDSNQSTIRRYETPGVITTDGRKVNMPQRHQLRSLYMDQKSRLYMVATDAICDRNESGFVFCNSKNGKGIIYVSKRSLP